MKESAKCKMITTLTLVCILIPAASSYSFNIDYTRDCFSKDGKCTRYISGEMHYFRIPQQYWRDRLLKLRAAGFTNVQTYIPWNVHQPSEESFNFQGIADVYEYMRIAAELGLTVTVRPGPFLATEWDYGGFPAWLLRDRPTLDVRRNETVFMREVERWYRKLLPTLVPFLYPNSGPIIAVQVENEYGSNKPCDAAHYDYLTQLRDLYRRFLGPDVVLFTVDGDSHRLAECGNIPGLYSTVNFGANGNTTSHFMVQRVQEPRGPFVCSAFFSGWLDHWGHRFAKVSSEVLARGLRSALSFSKNSASVSMYMFHGGTNFAYMQGGRGDWNNATTTAYPRLWGKMTSYDYDAPLSEAGDTTLKYLKIREVIGNYSTVYPVPDNTTKQTLDPISLAPSYDIRFFVQDLFHKHFPEAVITSKYPLPMEQMGQNHGIVVYMATLDSRTKLPAAIDIPLYGDRIYFVTEVEGETRVEVSSRNRPRKTFTAHTRELFILVEDNGHSNTGHVRYGHQLYQKGIVGNVTAHEQVVTGWRVALVSQALPRGPYEQDNTETLETLLAVLREGTNDPHRGADKGAFLPRFYIGLVPGQLENDTFVDTQGWGKGILAVKGDNGWFNLGRYWPKAGPQLRHYCPAPWCASSTASVFVLLELEQEPPNLEIAFADTPLLDGAYDSSQQ